MARFILRHTGTAEALPAQRQHLLRALSSVPLDVIDDSQRMLRAEISLNITSCRRSCPLGK